MAGIATSKNSTSALTALVLCLWGEWSIYNLFGLIPLSIRGGLGCTGGNGGAARAGEEEFIAINLSLSGFPVDCVAPCSLPCALAADGGAFQHPPFLSFGKSPSLRPALLLSCEFFIFTVQFLRAVQASPSGGFV